MRLQGVEVADLDQLGSSDGLVSSADLAVRSAALSLESEEMRLIR